MIVSKEDARKEKKGWKDDVKEEVPWVMVVISVNIASSESEIR